MATKNVMGKSRKAGYPYLTLKDLRTGWSSEVLKSYQANGSKPYARAFCNVHGFETELGDVYIADLYAGGQYRVEYFDPEVFEDAAAAVNALFGDGIPSAPQVW